MRESEAIGVNQAEKEVAVAALAQDGYYTYAAVALCVTQPTFEGANDDDSKHTYLDSADIPASQYYTHGCLTFLNAAALLLSSISVQRLHGWGMPLDSIEAARNLPIRGPCGFDIMLPVRHFWYNFGALEICNGTRMVTVLRTLVR